MSPLLGPDRRARLRETRRLHFRGLVLLTAILAVMWLVEVVNTLSGNTLDRDGIYARDLPRLWGIVTSPFIHASFQHLIDNSVPFAFLGVIIAVRGAARLALVTAFIILIGGFGTWLISPAHSGPAHLPVDTIGASGLVFGYAAYLLARGLFDRSWLELLIGAVVGVVWGATLVSSLAPHSGVSWQAHACGAAAGVIVAWRLSSSDARRGPRRIRTPQTRASGG